MTPETLDIALIIGSTREGRFGTTVAGWIADAIEERDDFDLDVIDLADREPAARAGPARRPPSWTTTCIVSTGPTRSSS